MSELSNLVHEKAKEIQQRIRKEEKEKFIEELNILYDKCVKHGIDDAPFPSGILKLEIDKVIDELKEEQNF